MNEKETLPKKVPDELADKLNQWCQANPKAALTEIEKAVEAKLARIRKELVDFILLLREPPNGRLFNRPAKSSSSLEMGVK